MMKLDFFKPAHIDDETGYRYYSSKQLPQIHKIISFRQMGFSLEEIMSMTVNGEDVTQYFERKEKSLALNISELNNQLSQIKSYLKELKGGSNMTSEVILKELPEVIVASMRQVIPDYNALFELCPNIMGKEMNRLGCECSVPAYCFNIYHDGEYKERDIDVEICEAVTELKEDTEILKFKKVEKIATAACILHKGAYSNLGNTYGEVFKWIAQNGYSVSGNPRESYIDGIWNKEKEEDWLTEIQVPITK
jgi:effector-binding domain-containing protein